jgi:hypothetical protein
MAENDIELNPGLKNLKLWTPGQSGNPHGRPKSASIIDAIREVMGRDVPGAEAGKSEWMALIEIVRDLAKGGSAKHAELLLKYGEPRQPRIDNRTVNVLHTGDANAEAALDEIVAALPRALEKAGLPIQAIPTAMDAIEEKFGPGTITPARNLKMLENLPPWKFPDHLRNLEP